MKRIGILGRASDQLRVSLTAKLFALTVSILTFASEANGACLNEHDLLADHTTAINPCNELVRMQVESFENRLLSDDHQIESDLDFFYFSRVGFNTIDLILFLNAESGSDLNVAPAVPALRDSVLLYAQQENHSSDELLIRLIALEHVYLSLADEQQSDLSFFSTTAFANRITGDQALCWWRYKTPGLMIDEVFASRPYDRCVEEKNYDF